MPEQHSVDSLNPCLTCGACCVSFRVSFHWLELASAGGVVPDELTGPLTPHLAHMQGTNSRRIRCVALDGDIGCQVACRIYEQRPSPCREFPWSGQDGLVNERCERARAQHGLPPLVAAPLRSPCPDS